MGLLPGEGREGVGRGGRRRRVRGRRSGGAACVRGAAPAYAEEQDAIEEKAKERERERDAKEREADGLLHLHHRYADAVAFFQVSIALGAVAALTRIRLVWLASMAIGGAGIVFALLALAGRP